MAKVTRKLEQLENLKREIEEAKEKIHSDFGEEIISELEIDYDMLDRKKDIKEVVQMIISEMNSNPFSNDTNKTEDNLENIQRIVMNQKSHNELIVEKNRLQLEIQREKEKERKQRTTRLTQKGALLEKYFKS